MRMKFTDILILALLFIFVIAFPTDLIPVSNTYRLLIQISLRLLILIYYIYICYTNRINIFKFYNWKRILLFTPFLLASFSNLIAAGIDHGYSGQIMYSDAYFSLLILYHFLGAIVEEFLFRLFIQRALVNASSIKRILVSAAIFALFHLLNIVNISSVEGLVTVAIQVVYNFGLGILLGFLYEYSYSLPACITLHFSFNFFNTVLFQYLGCECSQFTFYMTAVVIAVILAAYTFVIYRFVLSKNQRYFSE